MDSAIESLLALQDRDQRIRALQAELEALPKERDTRNSQIAALEAKLEQSRARAKEIEVERKGLEVEVQGKRDTIARYKTQQLQTRKNEEYAALAHEIEAAEKLIVRIEDRELELMEEAEALLPLIARAEGEFQQGRQQVEAQLAGLQTKEANIRTQLGELEAGRGQLLSGLDEELIERYERLFHAKGGSAIVAVEGEVCTGCHMKVPAQTVVEAKAASSIVSCPQCGRILFFQTL